MKKLLSSRETMKTLGISSERTLRLWNQSGRLRPVPGSGGQGRARLYDPAEIMQMKDHTSLAELLARVQFGFSNNRSGKMIRAGKTLPAYITGHNLAGFFFQMSLSDYKRPAVVRECILSLNQRSGLPLLADVPPPVVSWAHDCGRVLSVSEMAYLITLFGASEYPGGSPGRGKTRTQTERVTAQKGADRQTGNVLFRRIFSAFRENRSRQAWEDLHLLSELYDGQDMPRLLSLVQQYFPKHEKRHLFPLVKQAVLTRSQVRRRVGRLPSASSVAHGLQMSRMQGVRLWKSLLEKLSHSENVHLLKELVDCFPQADQRRFGKALKVQRPRQDSPTDTIECPECSSAVRVPDDVASFHCPQCGVEIVEDVKSVLADAGERRRLAGRGEKKTNTLHKDNGGFAPVR